MNLGHHKVWIQLYCFAERSFGVGIYQPPRDHRHAQAIKSNRVVRLQPRSTLGIHFRIGETFSVHRAGTWLDEEENELDQGIRIRGSKLNRLSISFFGIIPPLLIDK